MEKRRPTYDLVAFKAAFSNPDKINVTVAALQGAAALGMWREQIVMVIQSMTRSQFHKSMTSYVDHKIWQDVYFVPWEGETIYVKFTADVVTEFRLLSFKVKES